MRNVDNYLFRVLATKMLIWLHWRIIVVLMTSAGGC